MKQPLGFGEMSFNGKIIFGDPISEFAPPPPLIAFLLSSLILKALCVCVFLCEKEKEKSKVTQFHCFCCLYT